MFPSVAEAANLSFDSPPCPRNQEIVAGAMVRGAEAHQVQDDSERSMDREWMTGIEWSDSEVTTHSIDAKMAICHVD